MENPRILVPTDLSELSLNAYKTAGYLAEVLDGIVIPLHVYQPGKDISSFPVASELPRIMSEIEDKLEHEVRNYIKDEYLDPVIVRRGKPWKIIMEESEKADLVVMSPHGKSGFSRLLLGSVTERVVRFARTPVLLVDKDSKIKPLHEILLTTDFSDYSLQAFDYACFLVNKTDAHIHLVHLVDLQQFRRVSGFDTQLDAIKTRLDMWVDEHLADIRSRVTAEVLPVTASVYEAIVHLTTRKSYSLVVMSTLGHTGLEYLRVGSTAANVLRLVRTSVLSINPKRDVTIGDEHREH